MAQMKEKKSLEKEINEMEASSLPHTAFKTAVTNTLKELSGNLQGLGSTRKR